MFATEDLSLPLPLESRLGSILPKLKPYQVPSVRRVVRALLGYQGAIDASDTGVGKTYVAVAVAYVLNRPLFAICPISVIPSWIRVGTHIGHPVEACNYEALRGGNRKELYLVNEKQHYCWNLPVATLLAFDECHRLCNPGTMACRMGLAAIRQRYSVLGLSATMADNPSQMIFTGMICRLFAKEQDFPRWAALHGALATRRGVVFLGGESGMQRIHRQIFPIHGTRIRIEDLGSAFPPTQIVAECCQLERDGQWNIQSLYQEMDEEIGHLLHRQKGDRSGSILTTLLRTWQKVELLKVPLLADRIQDGEAEGMSVAVFVNFNETLDALAHRLGTRCWIRGGQSKRERERNLQAFQHDEEHIVLCNLRTSQGYGLHGAPQRRRRLSLLSHSYSARDVIQALGRVHREGGAVSIQRLLFAAGTVEENMCRAVQAKSGRIYTLNDGDLATGALREVYRRFPQFRVTNN